MFQFLLGFFTGISVSGNKQKAKGEQESNGGHKAESTIIISMPFREDIIQKHHKLFALFFYAMIFPTLLLVKPVYNLVFFLSVTIGGGNVVVPSFSEAEASFLQRVADEGWVNVFEEAIGFYLPLHEFALIIAYMVVFQLVGVLIANAVFYLKSNHTPHQKTKIQNEKN